MSAFVEDSATDSSRRYQLERDVLLILVRRKNKRRSLSIDGALPIQLANESVGYCRNVIGSPGDIPEYELAFAVYSKNTSTDRFEFKTLLKSDTSINGSVADKIHVDAGATIKIFTSVTGLL